jgi:hypothetical protein
VSNVRSLDLLNTLLTRQVADSKHRFAGERTKSAGTLQYCAPEMAGLTPGQTVETHPSLDNGSFGLVVLDVYAGKAGTTSTNELARAARSKAPWTVRFLTLLLVQPLSVYTCARRELYEMSRISHTTVVCR